MSRLRTIPEPPQIQRWKEQEREEAIILAVIMPTEATMNTPRDRKIVSVRGHKSSGIPRTLRERYKRARDARNRVVQEMESPYLLSYSYVSNPNDALPEDKIRHERVFREQAQMWRLCRIIIGQKPFQARLSLGKYICSCVVRFLYLPEWMRPHRYERK